MPVRPPATGILAGGVQRGKWSMGADMRATHRRSWLLGGVLSAALWAPPGRAVATVIWLPDATEVTVRDVTVDNGVVSGVLVNTSMKAVHHVRVLVRHEWVWDTVHGLKNDDPGRALFAALHEGPKEIPSGGRSPFTYRPDSPLPSMPGGRFKTTVEVVGFVEWDAADKPAARERP
jgi:hypothetical protein